MVGREISNKCYPNTIRMGKDMSNGTLILNVILMETNCHRI